MQFSILLPHERGSHTVVRETVIQVSLVVKHHDPIRAREEVVRRLNEWYTDPSLSLRKDTGFPDKTLLHYTIMKVKPIIQ